MSAQGTEFTINYNNKIGQVNFSVGGNIAYNVNKVLVKDQPASLRPYESEIDEPTYRIRSWNILVNGTGNGVIRTPIEAERIAAENGVGATSLTTANGSQIQPGMLFAQDQFGSSTGLFRNSPNGNVNHNGNDDKVWQPNKYGSPRMPFGLNANISYKGFELNMIAAGVGFYHRFINGGLLAIGQFQNFWPNEWTTWNINAGPSPMYGAGSGPNSLSMPGGAVTAQSTYWLKNATFLRMKNISLAYNIPAHLSRKVGIQGVKVYMNMENPFMIFKMCPKQYDPESAEGSSYPILRNYALGVNITL
jgi:hypothetical protein